MTRSTLPWKTCIGKLVNLLKDKFLLQAVEYLFTPKFSCQSAKCCLLLRGKSPLAVQTSCMLQPHFTDLRRPNMLWGVHEKEKNLPRHRGEAATPTPSLYQHKPQQRWKAPPPPQGLPCHRSNFVSCPDMWFHLHLPTLYVLQLGRASFFCRPLICSFFFFNRNNCRLLVLHWLIVQ